MKVLHSIGAMSFNPLTVVTIGTFDGVHLGHQTIIRDVIKRVKAMNGRSVVVTFNPHPREVIGKGPVDYLTTIEERLEYFEQLGIDETLVVNFTYEFSQTSARSFYEEYLVKQIGVHDVVIGHDHMFGRNREGSIDILQQLGTEMGFGVYVVPGVSVNSKVVSSSVIRKNLLSGNVESAAQYIGRPYSIHGLVVEGDKRGRQIGFPTANVSYDVTKKMTPETGVYVVRVYVGNKEYFGMLNIGVRPTFNNDGKKMVEVHLLDFEGDLYGSAITVSFLKRLRQEQKFGSVDELIAQLQRDRIDTQQFVSTLNH